ncbi:glycosyltransferase family 39 protein [Listeria monocytogenes]|uniref:glycosyltransferase family 39 protein n=1 Tax=Listeria monocytogenes TaxID=1639 RepID=UPI00098E70F6|nr:glycosyltransferase family 39 protein [Listeria monocytogenes]
MQIKKNLSFVFYGVFIFIFGYLLVRSIIKPLNVGYSNFFILLLFSITILIIMLALFQLFSRLNRKSDILFTLILVIALVSTQVYLMFALQMDAFADSFGIKGQAVQMLQNGGMFTGDSYFLVYPNNVLTTIIRYELYNFGANIGITNTYLLESGFVILCMNITFFTLFYIIRKEVGIKYSNIYLLIILFCVPFYGYLTYFYSDTLVLPFAALILLFYYLYTKNNKWFYFIIIGLLFAIGYHIKPNLIIMLPAIIIHLFFIKNWRKTLLNTAIILIVFAGMNTLYNPFTEKYGFERDNSLEFPQSHWIMMGLKGPEGRYDSSEFLYTKQFDTKEKKQEANKEVIKERITSYGPVGLLELYNMKMLSTWTDGTRAYSWYVKSAKEYPVAYDFLFGDKKVFADAFSQIFHIINLILVILGALRFYKKQEFDLSFLINITLIGVWLFHLVWEANQRYILFVTPLMIMSAMYGFKFLVELLYTKDKVPVIKQTTRKPFLIVCFVVFMLSLVTIIYGVKPIAIDKQNSNHYLVNQSYAYLQVPVNSKNAVTQTFKADENFNNVGIYVLEAPNEDNKYKIRITNKNENKIISEKVYSASSFEAGEYFPIEVNENPKKKTEYSIQILSTKGNKGEALMLGKYQQKGFDLYSDGAMYINGKNQINEDIGFEVTETTNSPLIPWYSYLLIFISFVGVISLSFLTFKQKKD